MKLVKARRMNRDGMFKQSSLRRAQVRKVNEPRRAASPANPMVQTTRVPLGPSAQSGVRWPRGPLGRRAQQSRLDEPEEAETQESQEEQEEQEETLEGALRRPALRRYGPPAQLGPHLQVQAAKGFRAGAIELRPGLWLVSEIPESALRPEFGAAALLAPLAMSVASQALQNPEQTAALVSAASQGVQALVNQLVGPPAPVAGWTLAGPESAWSQPRLLPPALPQRGLLRWAEPEAAGFGCDGHPAGSCPCTRRLP